MYPNHTIIEAPINNKKFDEFYEKTKSLTSLYVKAGYIIIARYGVNKKTLKKLLNAYFQKYS